MYVNLWNFLCVLVFGSFSGHFQKGTSTEKSGSGERWVPRKGDELLTYVSGYGRVLRLSPSVFQIFSLMRDTSSTSFL